MVVVVVPIVLANNTGRQMKPRAELVVVLDNDNNMHRIAGRFLMAVRVYSVGVLKGFLRQ